MRRLGAVLVVSTLLLSACSTDPSESDTSRRDDLGRVVGEGQVGVSVLRRGDCVVDADDLIGELSSVGVVPCSEPHEAQVFAIFEVSGPDGDSWPGQELLDETAQQGCTDRLDAVDPDALSEDLGLVFLAPSQISWSNDDREVICFISAEEDGDLGGDILIDPGSAGSPGSA